MPYLTYRQALGLRQATTHETSAQYGTLGSDKYGEADETMFYYKRIV